MKGARGPGIHGGYPVITNAKFNTQKKQQGVAISRED